MTKPKDIIIVDGSSLAELLKIGHLAGIARKKRPVMSSITRIKGKFKLTILF